MAACSQQAEGRILESRCRGEVAHIPASEDSCATLELDKLRIGRQERLDTPECWPISPTSSISTTFPRRSSGVGSSSLGCSSWPISESVFDDDMTESVSFADPCFLSDLGPDGDQEDFCLPLELDEPCFGRRERLDTPECWPISPTSSMSTTFPRERLDTLEYWPISPISSISNVLPREMLDTPECWPISPTSSISTTFPRERLDTPECWPMSPTSSISTTFPRRWSGVGSSGVDSLSLGCSSWAISESVLEDDVTESVSLACSRSVSDLGAGGDQKGEERKPKASKESGRARQRRQARMRAACRERVDTLEFWPGDDIESMVFPTSWRGSDDATLSCSLPVSDTAVACRLPEDRSVVASSMPVGFTTSVQDSQVHADRAQPRAKKASGRTRQRRANAMRKQACDL